MRKSLWSFLLSSSAIFGVMLVVPAAAKAETPATAEVIQRIDGNNALAPALPLFLSCLMFNLRTGRSKRCNRW